jgi:nucleotide-binding universal stress UspA family protein
MLLRHILAATDESDAGRQAVRTAMDLASPGAGPGNNHGGILFDGTPRGGW